MASSVNIAVVGATGTVGETMLSILAERQLPVGKVYALASERSVGEKVSFGDDHTLVVEDLATFDFSQAHIALFSAGGSVSAQYAPLAAEAGCVVIDNSSHFRYDDDVPLVVPEVNLDVLATLPKRGIIANPNCSTIQMVVALKPLHDAVGITRINVATYQSVSGSGKSGLLALAQQSAQRLNGAEVEVTAYPKQIGFNVLPQIDTFEDNGYTREEMKMVWETKKIFADESIGVNATAVRVPVFYGHAEAVHIETAEKISAAKAASVLREAPGVVLVDTPDFPTPMTEAVEHDAVFVGRLREDISHPQGLSMWVVADNVRKGAALNAVQIAEAILPQLS
jgi:aspartate-semialdehyde dehydrogenase